MKQPIDKFVYILKIYYNLLTKYCSMPIVLSGGFIVQIADKNLDSCSHLGGVKLIVIGLLDKLNFYSAIFCLCKDVVYQSANCEISSCSNFFSGG